MTYEEFLQHVKHRCLTILLERRPGLEVDLRLLESRDAFVGSYIEQVSQAFHSGEDPDKAAAALISAQIASSSPQAAGAEVDTNLHAEGVTAATPADIEDAAPAPAGEAAVDPNLHAEGVTADIEDAAPIQDEITRYREQELPALRVQAVVLAMNSYFTANSITPSAPPFHVHHTQVVVDEEHPISLQEVTSTINAWMDELPPVYDPAEDPVNLAEALLGTVAAAATAAIAVDHKYA